MCGNFGTPAPIVAPQPSVDAYAEAFRHIADRLDRIGDRLDRIENQLHHLVMLCREDEDVEPPGRKGIL